ncbi:MAG: hypothetical protein GY746_06705 [Gammaproteobacteria bacterium]|nr:hypothetical protein [Gammaproteobacteria bacterium]
MTTITMFLTIGISITIAVLFLYFLINPSRKTVNSAPSILTSIGIFGTFLGIAIGLMNFDPDNVIAGVPLFLSGIKLAFWSSVIGILAALLHRIRFTLAPYDDGSDTTSAESDATALDSLNRMSNSLDALVLASGDSVAENKFQELIDNLNLLGERVEVGMVDMAGGVSKSARELAEELKADESVLTMLRELREELARTSDAEQNVIKAQMQNLLDELKEDALAGEKQSESLLEVFAGLKDEIEKGAGLGKEASKEQMEMLFSGLSRAAAGTLGELSDVAQNLIEQSKWQAANYADEVTASTEASTKSMLAMLKDILHATEDSNQKITTELAKLRTDVAADVKASTEQSKALVEQLHSMTEAYKATLIATTTDLKAQISKDMKSSYSLIDKYTQNVAELTGSNQAESLERLEAIANIMQGVVSSASDMGTLLHENALGMSRMQEAFTGTNEGSLGRFMLNMNEDLISQISALESAFSAQGSMGVLLQDLNDETLKRLKDLEKAHEGAVYEMRNIPGEFVKGLRKLNWNPEA